MANPTLDTFDTNGTNTTPITAIKQTDGFAIEETVESAVHNEMFRQLFAAANKAKIDGAWDWETDLTYRKGALVWYNDTLWKSIASANQGNTPVTGAFWKEPGIEDAVSLTGDQTVDGIKEFLDSPIAPTPTLGDNSTKVATTEFVLSNSNSGEALIGGLSKPIIDGTIFIKTGPAEFEILAGTSVDVNGTIVKLTTNYALNLNLDLDIGTKTAGTDYYTYAKTDSTFYISADDVLGVDKLIGGFHYGLTTELETTSGNKTEADMVKIRGINEYSFWDLRYFSKSGNKGMFCNGNKFFDIYLGDEDYGLDFYSKPFVKIAGGATTNNRGIPKIPLIYGGDGTATYGKLTPFQAYDIANASKKQLISYKDFTDVSYGVVEGESAVAEPVSGETGHDANLTSKYGMEQATGTQYIWSTEIGASSSGSWSAIADGRGQVYTNAQVAVLGGDRVNAAGQSGSRCSLWGLSLSNSNWYTGFRLCSDLVIL